MPIQANRHVGPALQPARCQPLTLVAPGSALGQKPGWWYGEPLSKARTPHGKRRVSARRGRVGEKSDFFSILLEGLASS